MAHFRQDFQQPPPSPINLTQSRLNHLQQQKSLLDRDIYQNNAEIKYLNGKISKTDYQKNHLVKLQQRQRILSNKQRQMEQILLNHQYLQMQIAQNKVNEANFKHALGNEYQQVVQDKKRRVEEEKRRKVDEERLMIEHNKKLLEDDYMRKRMQMEEQKKSAQEELAYRQYLRQKEKEDREREKDQYNKKVQMRNQLQTQKDTVYKQYYSHFMEGQNKLQSLYKNKAGMDINEREQQRLEQQRRDSVQYQQRLVKEQEQKITRINQDKDMLRTFLQSQIEEKNRRKEREKSDELNYQTQVSKYQMNAKDIQNYERQRKREEQKRYDQELKQQTKLKSSSMSSPSSEQPRQQHNPITNPIDFKIGITNPYIIKQYEQTKQKHTGDQYLKLRNLAMVGNNSLVHH